MLMAASPLNPLDLQGRSKEVAPFNLREMGRDGALVALVGLVGFSTYLIHPSTWTLSGYCYLEDLFVEPSARGQGAGRLLIEAVTAIANEMEITRVYWHTHSEN